MKAGAGLATNRRAAGIVALAAVALAVAAFLIGERLGTSRLPVPIPSRLALVAPTLGGSGAASLYHQLALTPSGVGVLAGV